MECACTVDVDLYDSETPKEYEIYNAIAIQQCSCSECQRPINVGEHFCREWFLDDYNATIIFRTCDDCYSLRQVFFSSGWYYGVIWESFTEMVSEVDGDISVTCIKQLTPVARSKVLDLMDNYFIEQGEYEDG